MVRLLALLLLAFPAFAQQVDPDNMRLTLEFENLPETPYQDEMVLLTIRGVYRETIALEKLIEPSLEGFAWTQLGRDKWTDERIDGLPAKVFERRMALFPQDVGRIEVGAFRHEFTLTDRAGNRFAYATESEPIAIDVLEAPQDGTWWLPVRKLNIRDEWSNAIHMLEAGEGALRIVTITAEGVSPDMIPPMPALTSPSAFIFPHPERRVVDLTPDGPISTVWWRWTVRPAEGAPSAILDPIEIHYFDTVAREAKTVTLATQRMAVISSDTPVAPVARSRTETIWSPPVWAPLLAGLLTGLVLLGGKLRNRGRLGLNGLLRRLGLDPETRALKREIRNGNAAAVYRMLKLHLRPVDPTAREIESALFSGSPGEIAETHLPKLKEIR